MLLLAVSTSTLAAVLSLTFALYGLMATGAVLRRIKWIQKEADESLLRLNVHILLPCLVLSTLPGNPALDRTGPLFALPIAGALTVVIGTAIAWFLARPLAGLQSSEDRRTFSFIGGVYNYSYLPIPLIQAFSNTETLGTLFLFNLGIDLTLWTFSLYVLTGGQEKFSYRRLLTPMTLVIPFSLLVHYTGLWQWTPSFVLQCIQMLGKCAIPLALLLIGTTTYDLILSEKSPLGHTRSALSMSGLRLVLLPALFILAAFFLSADDPLRKILVIQAAMPCAAFPIVMVRYYGGNSGLALTGSALTWFLGLGTMPLILTMAKDWIGF